MTDTKSVAQSSQKSNAEKGNSSSSAPPSQPPQKKPKRPIVEIFEFWSRLLDGETADAFSLQYGVFIEADGTRTPVILNQETNSIERIDRARIVEDIIQASNRMFVGHADAETREYAMSPRNAIECATYWIAVTKNVYVDVKTVAFKNDDSVCFHRIPFADLGEFDNIEHVGQAFADISKRMENFDAFAAWIWSLFEGEKDRRQYIWLYGEGQSGKSQITEAISRLFGDSVTQSNPKVCKRDNWTYSLLGKKLCILPEADPTFPASEMFKSITGDNRHRVNEKYLKPFDATIDTKFIFVSNNELVIGSDRAAMSRAILCYLNPYDGPMLSPEKYQEKLAMEMPIFIGYCKRQYRLLAESGYIKADFTFLEHLAEETEFRFEEMFDHCFELDESCRLPVREARCALNRAGCSEKDYREIKQWMKRKYGVEIRCAKINKVVSKYYLGIRVKSNGQFRVVKDNASQQTKLDTL